MKKKEMTLDDAAQFIASHPLNIDPEHDDSDAAEQARVLAFQALLRASETILSIRMTSDIMHIDFAENIGTVMNNDDVSSDINGQRYYSIHALLHATGAIAKEMVDDGYEVDQIMGYIMDSLKNSLECNLGVNLEIGEMDAASVAEFLGKESSKDESLLS